MMRIAVTGGDGLLGQHLRMFLDPQVRVGEVSLVTIARTDWDPISLRSKIAGADAVVHLAGMNRGDEQEMVHTNSRLVGGLLSACEAAGAAPHIVFPSSTHAERDTAYGRSKRECAAEIEAWAAARGSLATVLVLPHVFGEFAKPFHNSGIATMCHQLAKGEPSEINPEGMLEIIHARDVAAIISARLVARHGGKERVAGTAISVPDAYALLSGFTAEYRRGILPAMNPGLETQLFTTLHAYLAWEVLPHALTVRSDVRGSLFETVRGSGPHQVFFSSTNPGFTRGNHYHTRKMERFCVVQGTAEIRLRRMLTDEVRTFAVSGAEPVAIDMPTYWTHSITNTGSGPLLTAFWASEPYDPADPDTFTAET